MRTPQSITIRAATPRDADDIERLAQLEGVRPPDGELLVAEVEGAVWAAVELTEEGTVLADPFRRSGGVADMLRLRRR